MIKQILPILVSNIIEIGVREPYQQLAVGTGNRDCERALSPRVVLNIAHRRPRKEITVSQCLAILEPNVSSNFLKPRNHALQFSS